jgi:TRAP-type C4-dicarboxylate transport system permease small subunit
MAAEAFGYLLIAISAVLLALHWQQWRDLATRQLPPRDRIELRSQLQRRLVASSLIGVVGAAMTLAERIPRTPWSLTLYLVALLVGGVVILAIALADLRASRRRRELEHLDLVARELEKTMATHAEPEPDH